MHRNDVNAVGPVFPFTALVGQADLKQALVLALVNPAITGVLIRGERGTGKSTAVRAISALLPELKVVDGCGLRCDPDSPRELCPDCRRRREERGELPWRRLPMPVVELPLGATEEMIIGTLDLEEAVSRGKLSFRPGLLARAHRGVLYIDEVNLLADHLVDVLLDAAAMGVNYVEREGVSFSHPCRMLLVGTMNPQEGELRPQLVDRFDLCIEVRTIAEPEERQELLRRRLIFERDAESFCQAYAERQRALAEHIRISRERLSRVVLDEGALQRLVAVAAEAGVEGHRAELAMGRTAAALCACDGRWSVSAEDIATAARLVLAHRLKAENTQQKAPAQFLDQVLQRVLGPRPGQAPETEKKKSS